MEREVIWLDNAIASYFDILNYIESSFGQISGDKFIIQVYEAIDTIVDFTFIGKSEFNNSKIRGLIIAKKQHFIIL